MIKQCKAVNGPYNSPRHSNPFIYIVRERKKRHPFAIPAAALAAVVVVGVILVGQKLVGADDGVVTLLACSICSCFSRGACKFSTEIQSRRINSNLELIKVPVLRFFLLEM